MHDAPGRPGMVPTASSVWVKDWTGSQEEEGEPAWPCLGWAHPIPATPSLPSTNSGQRAQGHRHETGRPGGVPSAGEGTVWQGNPGCPDWGLSTPPSAL